MESRGAVLPGTPRPNPTTSYWQEPVDEIADLRSSESLPKDADIVIVGGGISGASIAYNILTDHPDRRVILLEARQAASGASGRNGGHTKHSTYRSFLENVDRIGAEDAIKSANFEYDCMLAVHDFIRKHEINCDAKRCDSVDIFYDPIQWQKAQKSIALMRDLIGEKAPTARYTLYDAEETESKFKCPNAVGSLTFEAGSLSAYKFTIAMLKLALAKNLNLQTNTVVQNVEKVETNGRWLVETLRGSITAPTVILATNGYTANLYPKLQGIICPYRGIITAQRPGKAMPQTGLDITYSFIYEKGYEYMISRPAGSKFEGDIIIGGGMTKTIDDGLYEYGNTDDTVVNEDIVKYLTNSTSDFFGNNWGEDNPEGRVRKAWSGVMGYSGDGYPLVGPIPGEKGLFIDASFQGHGMVLCFLCAKAVTQMVLGQEEGLDKWFPNAYRMSEKRYSHKFRGRAYGAKAVESSKNSVNGTN